MKLLPLMWLRVFLLIMLLSAMSSCVSPASTACRNWMKDGDFYSTMDSCRKCVDTLGTNNKDAVKGCAMGLDASSLMR